MAPVNAATQDLNFTVVRASARL